MKRITLVLVFAAMLGLCACGQAEVPVSVTEGETATVPTTITTTTEAETATEPELATVLQNTDTRTTKKTVSATTAPILEPVILNIVEQGWSGWAAVYGREQPKPKDLGTHGVDVGSTLSFFPGMTSAQQSQLTHLITML